MTGNLEMLYALAGVEPLRPSLPRFYFLRHGETLGNHAKIIQSPTDPLNETGRRQAEAAAEVLRDAPFERIFASDFRRAHETAKTVARVTAKPLSVLPNLGERVFGRFAGASNVHLDWAAHPPGGESLFAFVTRTKAGLADALGRGAMPLIVAHGGTLRVLAGALGMVLSDLVVANATPLHFEREGDGWRLDLVASASP
ncbi:MAG: histidine phosphatase family protein [Alphaproteobacteria bacterium]|nr:histidine phosphatase family protein [Alphaproteobacteria bacterium]